MGVDGVSFPVCARWSRRAGEGGGLVSEFLEVQLKLPVLPPGWCLVEMQDLVQRTCTVCLGTMGKRDDKDHHPALQLHTDS